LGTGSVQVPVSVSLCCGANVKGEPTATVGTIAEKGVPIRSAARSLALGSVSILVCR
jgi:hypothetical protein